MALAGRCACGLLLELVAQDPEPHLPCRGEKRCRGCDEAKPLSEFWRYGAQRNFAPYARCKGCWRKEKREKYQSHEGTRERIKANAKKFHYAHKLQRLERKAKWYVKNQDRERARARAYRLRNRELELQRQRRYQQEVALRRKNRAA